MHITPEQIEAIASRLKEAPPVPRPLTAQEAVRKLAPAIRGMLGKGYSLEQITDKLNTEGIQISVKTLSRYLRGGKAVAGRRSSLATVSPVGNRLESAAETSRNDSV